MDWLIGDTGGGRAYSSLESCSPKSRKALSLPSNVKSCFPYNSLKRIATQYNKQNPDDPITIHHSREDLHRAIREKMHDCRDERCWTRSRFLTDNDRKVLVEDFKPPLPEGKHTWLNTTDIERVLRQYEKVFPSFVSLGVWPVDFQHIAQREFNPLRVPHGKRYAALVLNLDKHDEPGSHWVALFLDLKQRVVEYFDSFGDPPPQEVPDWVEKLNLRARKKKWKLRVNRRVHQLRNSECGVYAIHFIVRRLSGENYDKVVNNIIRDDRMNGFRKKYFDARQTYDNRG
jgi:hypothetical protein